MKAFYGVRQQEYRFTVAAESDGRQQEYRFNVAAESDGDYRYRWGATGIQIQRRGGIGR